MTDGRLQVAVVIGSVRDGRLGGLVGNWFADQARKREDFAIDVVDLATLDLPTVLPAFGGTVSQETESKLQEVTPRLAAADAFVVVTPEYNHSFPASLKNLIDWHMTEWQAKPVGFVSYGGIAGGLRAVEHLRLVFAEVHAVGIRDTVSFPVVARQIGPDGTFPLEPDECTNAAKTLLDQLEWWGWALREARDARPYRT